MITKTEIYSFRATNKEGKKLEHLMQKSKLNRSKVICKLINNARIYEAPKVIDSETKHQFSMIGNNINQIAKTGHITGKFDISALQNEVEILRKRVDELYGDTAS